MKYIAYLFLLINLIIPPCFAGIPPGQWLCFAFDKQKQSYEGLGKTLVKAQHDAIANCRSTGKLRTCKTAQSYCQQGPTSLIDNRCVVSDLNGRTWNATGHDACKTALSICTEWQFLHGKTSQCSVKHR